MTTDEIVARLQRGITASDGVDISAETLRLAADRLAALEAENAVMRVRLDHLTSIDKQHDRSPRIIDIAYTAFLRAKETNDEDGGPTDWFTDTYPRIVKLIETARAALIHKEET